ncbi:MAG: hypothetical protein RL208_593 [Pseudomonadota bacterium]|jgi:phosphoserine phosphatase
MFNIMTNTNAEMQKQPITFIFDFDNTFYNGSKYGSMTHVLFKNTVKRVVNEGKNRDAIVYINNNLSMLETKEDAKKMMQTLHKNFRINIEKSDFDKTLDYVVEHKTEGLIKMANEVQKMGHKVIILGGGAWGCGIIPQFAKKELGLEKCDIYSGYLPDFSFETIGKTLDMKYKYMNCEDKKLPEPLSQKKSELIRKLKNEGKIKGMVVHIGDGENDLEVWNAKEADYFIGFGVNKYREVVEKGSEIYVKTMVEFENEIKKILLEYNKNNHKMN